MDTIALGGAFVLSIFGQPVYASEVPPIPIVESIEQRIDRVATEYGIATTTLYNLVMGESSLNPNALGDMDSKCPVGANKGLPVRARGLLQITQCYNADITDAQAFSPDWSLNWGANIIAKGEAWKHWTLANCYSYAKTQINNLPSMKDIQPNTDYPSVGGLVILYYGKTKHLSVITKVTKEGIEVKETNWQPMKFTKRTILWNDKNIDGFWRPTE